MTATILLAEGDPRLAQSLGRTLELEGYAVLTAPTGEDAIRRAATVGPDLVLLADPLPDRSGVAACRGLRDVTAAPIYFLSARHQDTDKVVGLDAGADDYITRPFSTAELLARIRAGLRRVARLRATTEPPLRIAGLAIDVAAHRVNLDGRPISLTPREFELLRVLAEHQGRVVGRQRLLHAVWGPDFFGDDGILDVYVRTLRKKVEPDPARPAYIATVRGVGYRLDHPTGLAAAS